MDYTYIIWFATTVEIFFSFFFYTSAFRRKKHYHLRVLTGAVLILVLLYLINMVLRDSGSFLGNLFLKLFLYAYFLICLFAWHEEKTSSLLLCMCSAVATQTIVGRLYEWLFVLFGKNPYTSLSFWDSGLLPIALDWVFYVILHIVLLYLVSRLFRPKKVYIYNAYYTNIIIIYSIVIIVITLLLTTYSRPMESQHLGLAGVVRIFSILYAMLVLILRTGILEQGRMADELKTAEDLLYAEKKQFKDIKSEMEIINMKCHDIRHQLDQYAGRLTASELEELRNAVNIYDASYKTGNDILDMVIYKKRLLLDQNGIILSSIADGSCLWFMSSSDLFSLISNAFDNAIKAVMQLEDKDMRRISLSIAREGEFAMIHLTNFFDRNCVIEDGLPKTTGTNDPDPHGYGTKSMRYIVQQYSGSISFSTEENVFYLDIAIPIPDKASEHANRQDITHTPN